MPQTITDPYWEKCHCCNSHSRHIFSKIPFEMFSRKFIPLSGRLGNGYWIKDIVLEPDTKCNVPSFPEICTCLCKKRLAEILRQANSKKSGTSDDHIHTARKFHIQLYRIRNRRYHDHGTTVALVSDIHLVDQHCKPVRNNHLFKQSPDDPITALKYILCFYRFIFKQRIFHIFPSADRTFYDYREESKKQCGLHQTVLCLYLSPVHICHISDCR